MSALRRGDKVTVQNGPWTGRVGVVERVEDTRPGRNGGTVYVVILSATSRAWARTVRVRRGAIEGTP